MTENMDEPKSASGSDEEIRRRADLEPGQTLGIDNTDTALSPEDTGYHPEQEPDETPAGKGSDPPLGELP